MQNPVYMVFACLVADQDLLFVLYDVPCISICRAEQRAKALERLGMPNTVYKEIEERGGGHVVAPVPARNTATNDDGTNGGDSSAGQDMGGIWAAIARQTSQAKGTSRTAHPCTAACSISPTRRQRPRLCRCGGCLLSV